MPDKTQFTRRSIIRGSLALAVCGLMPRLARAALPQAKQLGFYNIHTGESLKTVYWEKGAYIPESLRQIAHVLRDHRTGEVQPIDLRLLDILADLHMRMESGKPFEVISGYRSPKSNAWLHENTSGVASGSLHVQGRAIDIHLPGRSLSALRDTAWNMQQGGVGYYPASNFVHVDTGKVRAW